MWLSGSCRCHAVKYRVFARSPYPFLRCYCSICRKTAGGGGYAINLGADFETFDLTGESFVGLFQVLAAETEHGGEGLSPTRRHFCRRCATALWVYDPRWPELIHPFASCVDTALPRPTETLHMMLDYKANWVTVPEGPAHRHFARYTGISLEGWHRSHGLYDESDPGPPPALA